MAGQAERRVVGLSDHLGFVREAEDRHNQAKGFFARQFHVPRSLGEHRGCVGIRTAGRFVAHPLAAHADL